MARPNICCNASKAPINNNGTPVFIFAIFCTLISTPAPAQALAFTLAPVFVLSLLKKYIDKDL